jgi:hypothetical protein
MQDAVGLIGNTLLIEDVTYVITNVYFVPDSGNLYITLNNKGVSVNYLLDSLLPYIAKQIKL